MHDVAEQTKKVGLKGGDETAKQCALRAEIRRIGDQAFGPRSRGPNRFQHFSSALQAADSGGLTYRVDVFAKHKLGLGVTPFASAAARTSTKLGCARGSGGAAPRAPAMLANSFPSSGTGSALGPGRSRAAAMAYRPRP